MREAVTLHAWPELVYSTGTVIVAVYRFSEIRLVCRKCHVASLFIVYYSYTADEPSVVRTLRHQDPDRRKPNGHSRRSSPPNENQVFQPWCLTLTLILTLTLTL